MYNNYTKGRQKERNPSNLGTHQSWAWLGWGGGRGGGPLQTNPNMFGRLVLNSGTHEVILKTILDVLRDWANKEIYPCCWEPEFSVWKMGPANMVGERQEIMLWGVDCSYMYCYEFTISKIYLCVHLCVCMCMDTFMCVFTSLSVERAKKQIHPRRNKHPQYLHFLF